MNLYLLSILDNVHNALVCISVLSFFVCGVLFFRRKTEEPQKPQKTDWEDDDWEGLECDSKEYKEARYKQAMREYLSNRKKYATWSAEIIRFERIAIVIAIITGAILILTPTRRSLMEAWAMTEVPAKVDRAIDILEKEY